MIDVLRILNASGRVQVYKAIEEKDIPDYAVSYRPVKKIEKGSWPFTFRITLWDNTTVEVGTIQFRATYAKEEEF